MNIVISMSLDPFFDLPKHHGKHLHRYLQELSKIVDTGSYILGERLSLFEAEFNRYVGNKGFSCGVGNATDGLVLSLKALSRFTAKKKVLTTPLSYIASASSIALSGLEPVFVDIDDTGNINPEELAKFDLKDVLGCLFVHYSGNPTNIDKIQTFCIENRIFLIEDCAQAMGSMLGDEYVGNFGDISSFSFHPLKILSGLGDAGLVYTRSKLLRDHMFKARNHGHITRDNIDFFSENSRLDEIQAAFLKIQLEVLSDEILIRQNQADQYQAALDGHGVKFLCIDPSAKPSYNFVVALVDDRDAVFDKAFKREIELKVHYPRLLSELGPISKSCSPRPLKKAQEFVGRIISFPVGSQVSVAKIDKIISLF